MVSVGRLVFGVAFWVLVSGGAALAQGTVNQSGGVFPGHLPVWQGNGVVQDGGFAGGAPMAGQALGEFVQVNPAVPPPSGPDGTHSCFYSAPLTSSYNWLCLDANALGGPIIDVGSSAGNTALTFRINGINYPIGSVAGMTTNAANALLPDARTNLGLGTGSSPAFAGLALGGATLGTNALAVTGTSQFNTGLVVQGGINLVSAGFGGLYGNSVQGGKVFGSGSTCDVTLANKSGASALCVATGKQQIWLGNGLGGNQLMSIVRPTTGGTDNFDFVVNRIANYTGGTANFENYGGLFETTVSTNTTSNEFNLSAHLTTSATIATSALYDAFTAQARKTSTANVFGETIGVVDYNLTTVPTGAAVANETDVIANGTTSTCTPCSPDPNANRTGIHIETLTRSVADGGNGFPATVSMGLKIGGINPGATGAITTGLAFDPAYWNTLVGAGEFYGPQIRTTQHGIDFAHQFAFNTAAWESPGASIDGVGIFRGTGHVLKAPASLSVNTSQAQAAAGTVLPFASVSGVAPGMVATNASIPANDQVKSVLQAAQSFVYASGTSANGQKVITISWPASDTVPVGWPVIGEQCTDITTPGAIGAGNVITATFGSGVGNTGTITMHDNLTGSGTADGDQIQCDPTVMLVSATSGPVASGQAITFASPPASMITYDGTNKFSVGIIADSNAFASSSNAVLAVQNFGTDAAGTYESEWDVNGTAKLVTLQAAGSPPTPSGACAIKTQLGGNTAGSFLSNGGCTASTVILTFAATAPNGWVCTARDLTTPTDTMNQTAYGTGSCTFTGTMVANDLVTFEARAF